jgi:hypothetical protein
MGDFDAAAFSLSATPRSGENGTVERQASPCQTGVACPMLVNPQSESAVASLLGDSQAQSEAKGVVQNV